MKLIKVAAGVVNQTPLAWDDNRDHLLAAIELAKADGVSILCLPELCITGYGCEDAFHSPGVQLMAWQVLHEILPATKGMVVSLGLPLAYQNAIYNTACLVADGKIMGFVGKRFLAGDGLHYEPRWFKPWPEGCQVEFVREGQAYKLGDLYFDCGGVRIGFEICEDAWVADRPGDKLSRRGVDVILNPSASHFAFGKLEVRQRFVLEGSRAFGVSYLYANLMGNEAGRAIYDGGALIASGGKLCAVGPRFLYQNQHLTTATIDVDQTRMQQARIGSFSPLLTSTDPGCVSRPFVYPSLEPTPAAPVAAAWEVGPHIKEEEFARAVSLALFDYMRKSHSRGFVVSLSGGADSAAVSCLVRLMVEFGVAELGVADFTKKLNYMAGMNELPDIAALMPRLLTCVYQATHNSSSVTLNAARTVAEAVNAKFLEFDVDGIVQSYTRMVANGIGRELTWEQDDIALQNIQARGRAPGVWMLANLNGGLLLATSNRSEAAVGYATMDGDTCGGLSPIAGIDKAFLRQWLRWMETVGPLGLAPLPTLKAVNQQAPTAELRPQAAEQTDESDLMPYPLLDAIERAAIRDKRTPLECYRLMRGQFPQYTPGQLSLWVERFFRLWCRNQWKRERYAPSFHVDDENLDPKTWCRFPILSGGFDRELREMRNYIENTPTN